jgi:hypothetical protein
MVIDTKKNGRLRDSDILKAVMAVLFLVLGSVAAFAQVTNGTILGTVTDPSGAVVAGAKITITNTDTGVVTNVVSKGSGNYTAPYLINGTYAVKVESPGFKTFQETSIQLTVGEEHRVDAKLQIGKTNQEVVVVSSGPALRTENSDLSTTIDARTLTDTPNINDNPLLTVILVPGVSSTGTFMDPNNVNTGDNARQNFTSFSVNGSAPLVSNIQLDGAMDTSPYANEILVMPNVNAIAESHIITNSYSAEYGRAGGGVVNLTTKSGTEKYHVVAFENFRNTALDANSYGNDTYAKTASPRPKAPFNSNGYGATIGGPLNIPKLYDSHGHTFFFASYAGLRRNQGTSTYFTVPTARERTGDFSQTFTDVTINGVVTPEPVSIYLPFPSTTTTNTIAAGQYQIVRQQASNNGVLNVLAPAYIDPTAAQIINYYPLPNIPAVNPDGTSNYFTNYVTNIRTDQMIVRVDDDFSPNKRGFFRYTTDWTLNTPPNIFALAPTPHPEANNNGPTSQYNPTATAGFDWTLSPKDVVEFRVNISRLNLLLLPAGSISNLTSLGFAPSELNAIPSKSFPSLTIGSYAAMGLGSFVYRNNHTTVFSLTPNYTKLLNKMSVKVGMEYDAILYNFFQPYKASIAFASAANGFSAHCEGTNCPGVASSNPQGWGAANFLMGANDGALGNGEYATGDPSEALKNGAWAGYVQDDWKAARNLTLNLGLRYEFQGPITDRYNRLSQFNLNGVNETGTAGLYEFSGVGGDPRSQVDPAWKNWAPRVGFAYRVNDKTVVSGAYGISYVPTTGGGSGAQGFGSDGFAAPSYDTIRPTTGIDAGLDILATPWTNAFSGGGTSANANPLNPVLLGGSVTAFIRTDKQTPYMQQYNFAVQRQLPANMIMQVAYVGTHGVHLQLQQFPVNQTDDIPLSTLNSALSTYEATGINPLSTKVANPFYGVIKTNTNLDLATITQLYLDEPFPAYGGVTKFFDRVGKSTYNSLQVSVNRAFRNGFQVSGAYTFSKNMDLGTAYGAAVQSGSSAGTAYYLQGMRHLDWSISDFDQAHRGVISTIWQVPVGKGHRLVGNVPVLSQIIGGWQFSSITTFASGYPLPITGTGFGRPNVIADPRLPKKDKIIGAPGSGTAIVLPTGQSYTIQAGYKLFFNPDAFSANVIQVANTTAGGAPINVSNPYYYSNAPRLFSELRGPGIDDFDMNLSHAYVIHEKYNIYVRCDAYNVFNRVQPGLPGTGFGGPNLTTTGGFIGENNSTTFGSYNMATAGTAIGQSSNLPRYIQFSGKFSF